MKHFSFAGTTLGILGLAGSAAAEPLHLRMVATRCVPLQDMRVVPGNDAKAAGESYRPLSAANAALVSELAKKIFASDTPAIKEVPVVYFSGTTPSGEQWKKEGNWPTQAVRAQTGNCTLASPQSLGQKGSVDYAFVEATCQSGREPWTSVRLGIEIANRRVISLCANIGDYGSLVMPEERHDAER